MERKKYAVGVFPGGRPSHFPPDASLFLKRMEGPGGRENFFSREKKFFPSPGAPFLFQEKRDVLRGKTGGGGTALSVSIRSRPDHAGFAGPEQSVR